MIIGRQCWVHDWDFTETIYSSVLTTSVYECLSHAGTVRVRSWHFWQTQGNLSEIFDYLTWFSTWSLSLECTLSFLLSTQCLCTVLPTYHVRAARENTKCSSCTKFRDPGSQFESHSDPQHKHNGACGFVGEVVRGGGAATTWQECSTLASQWIAVILIFAQRSWRTQKLPLPKFSDNDLRLLWNVSHIPATSLC